MVKRVENPREEMFVKHYIANDFNATEAAVAAGYSPNGAKVTACRMLQKPRIKELLKRQMQKTERKLEITFEWKIKKLKACVDSAINEVDGRELVTNHNALLGAINELNKMQGHYAPEKRQVEHSMDKEQAAALKELIKQHEREY